MRDATLGELPAKERGEPSADDGKYAALERERLIGDDGKPIDKRLLLEGDLLWRLLAIPFSIEVAEATVRLDSATQGRPTAGIRLAEPDLSRLVTLSLPAVIRDRLANALDKPVADLSDSDLGAAEKLNLAGAAVSLEDFRSIKLLPALKEIDCSDTGIGDTEVAALIDSPNLRVVSLNRTAVTDSGMASIAGLHQLQSLSLYGTTLGDDGLAQIARLPQLRFLSLGHVSLPGLHRLAACKNLSSVGVISERNSNATATEIAAVTTSPHVE